MTDRLKGFTVALVTDIQEDDAQDIAAAIGMVKGVLSVTPIVADPADWIIERRVEAKYREHFDKLWKARTGER